MAFEKSSAFDRDAWRENNPVAIQSNILEMIAERRKRGNDPTLTEEEFSRLAQEHRRRMQGDSEDDLFYQLVVLREYGQQGAAGAIEDQLRVCYCGSGKKLKDCHYAF